MNDRQQFIDELRDFADWLEANPLVPTPVAQRTQLWASSAKQAALIVRAFGNCTKEYGDDGYFRATPERWRALGVYVATTRETVCGRVVVGVETVVESVPVTFETRETEREIVEWKCAPILAASEAVA